MSIVALTRPDAWNWALLVHVGGAMILVGAVLTAGTASLAMRGDTTGVLARFSYRTLLFVGLPGERVDGGRFAYLPIRHLGGELQISVIPTTTANERTSATIIVARAHLVGNLPLGKFRPFVLPGAVFCCAIPR